MGKKRIQGGQGRFRRPRLAPLLFCGLLIGLPPNSGTSPAAPERKNPVGLNLDLNEQSIVNLVDMMRIPDAAGQDQKGWPTSDFTLLLDNRYVFAWSPETRNADPLKYSTSLAGHYRLSYTGQADVAPATNSRYDRATNTTLADFDIVEPDGGPGSLLVRIPFVHTRRTPDSPVGSGVTDIRLVSEDYAGEPKRIFTDLWLNSIRQYSWAALRCMEILKMNDYGLPGTMEAYPYRLSWDTDRRPPAVGPLYDKSRPGAHGLVSWEDVVAIGQLTRKDLWINIPVNASDDYVDQLALLLRSGNGVTGGAGVPPDINIYVEYSNELWHGIFPQGRWNFQAAQDEVAAGGTNLNYDGALGTPEQWRFRRIAKRTVEIGRQFRKIFAERPERIRPVISNHATGAYFDMLQYVAANYGRPSDVLYGIAQQGYYGSKDSSSVQAILAGERAVIDQNKAGYIASRTLATYYGLHSLAYEGGQEEKGAGENPAIPDPALSNKFQAARAFEMKEVVMHDLLDNWFPSGGELYVAFSQVSRYSFWGMWGLTEDLTNLNTGKWLGHVASMEAPPPPVTAGVMLPSVARQSVDLSQNPGTTARVLSAAPEPWAMFLLNVPAGGTYSFVARGIPESASSELRLMIDNSLAGDATFPSRSKKESAATPVRVALAPGLHSLFIFLHGKGTVTLSPGARMTVTRLDP